MPHYRTIFISDLHLGGSCNEVAFLNFLRDNDALVWYIVGDFLDFWAIKRHKSWSPGCSLIIQKILRKARKGERFIIIPGNHDTELRIFQDFKLDNISFLEKATFTTAAGKRYAVLHGDIFDSVIGHALWLSKIGAVAYDALVRLNTSLNWVRKIFGFPFWSFSAAIKRVVISAVSYVSDFEASLIELAKQYKMDGVICGHIHTQAMKHVDGIEYINTGDWVESLTAVVENDDGSLELKHYTEY
jgi:UDP-2,3-diacylglucosamine pyrophosphatase LpxH